MIKKKIIRRFKIKDLINRNFFKTFIVAEIGINHDGDFKKCKKLIDVSSKAGADAVKLQTINPKESYHENTKSFKAFKNKDFSLKELMLLKKFAEKRKIILFSTPGDIPSLEKISKAGFKLVKISSGLCTNLPLIEATAKKKIPMIISTGMTYLDEIKNAIQSAKKYNNVCVGLLKCTSLYPANDTQINLNSIRALEKKFNIPVGFSDHTIDNSAAPVAVGLGASIFEKHFTLDKSSEGPDHFYALEPNELKDYVNTIKNSFLPRFSVEINFS